MPDTVTILSARGTFYRVPAYEDYSPAYYAIDELVRTLDVDGKSRLGSMDRQIEVQKEAQRVAQTDAATIQRVQQRLSQPSVLAADAGNQATYEGDLDQLRESGALTIEAREALRLDMPENSADIRPLGDAETAGETYLPPALDSAKARILESTQKIENLEGIRSETTTPKSLDRSQILIMGVQLGKRDIVSQVPCLNNAKVLYSFGQNFGDVAIRGEVLLGAVGQKDSAQQGVKSLTDFFESNRVSRSLMPIAVSVASHAFYVYLTGLVIHDIDPEFHVMPFVMMGTLLDLSKEDMRKVNPAGQVLSSQSLDDPALVRALGKRKSVRTLPDVDGTGASDNTNPALDDLQRMLDDIKKRNEGVKYYEDPAAAIKDKQVRFGEDSLSDDERQFQSIQENYATKIADKDRLINSTTGETQNQHIRDRQALVAERDQKSAALGESILEESNTSFFGGHKREFSAPDVEAPNLNSLNQIIPGR